jgi:hypothetical protein
MSKEIEDKDIKPFRADLIRNEGGRIEMVANPEGRWFVIQYDQADHRTFEQKKVDAYLRHVRKRP